MKMLDFPDSRQTFDYDCGAKAMNAVLAYYGFDVSEIEIIKIAKTNKKSGTSISGMIKVAEHFGLKSFAKQMTIREIKGYINRKIPVILVLQAWSKRKIKNWSRDWGDGHYVVAVGYDKNHIYFEDPASIPRTYLSFAELKKRWHDKDSRKKYLNFGIVVFGRKKYSSKKIIHMS